MQIHSCVERVGSNLSNRKSRKDTRMTKYVTMHRPERRFSFWQRTLTVFLLALIVLITALAMIYSRTFPLESQELGNQEREIDAITTPLSAFGPTLQATEQTNEAAANNPAVSAAPTVTTAGSRLFRAPAASIAGTTATANGPMAADGGSASNTTTDTTATSNSNPGAVDTGTAGDAANLDERPELLRDLRLSEQALEEAEPRAAIDLLLALRNNYPTFRPAEVTTRLYSAYLALGDQAMRREARSEAMGFYNQAGQLEVADSSALQRRRDAIARLYPALLTGQQAAAAIPTTAAIPTAAIEGPAVAAPTATSPAVAAPAGSVGEPVGATATPTPVAPIQIQVAPLCPDDHIALSAPTVRALVSGTVAVVGSVRLEDLWFYKLEWAPAGSDEFAYFGGGSNSVQNGVLGRLNTTDLPNGEQVIRVTVVDQTGNYPPPCDVPIVVEN